MEKSMIRGAGGFGDQSHGLYEDGREKDGYSAGDGRGMRVRKSRQGARSIRKLWLNRARKKSGCRTAQ